MNSFYEKVLNYIVNHFGKLLPDRLLIQIRYRVIFHMHLHLKNPQTFNEKIQWLKLNDHNVLYHKMADKYEVREFVKERIGEQYLIPLLGHWETAEKIDFSTLPEQFVLKCTHDSQSIIICREKSKLNEEYVRSQLQKALDTDYSILGREWAYKGIRPTVVAEKLLVDESGYDLKDYKVFCFNGIPRFIQVDYDRFNGHKRRLYTTEWDIMPVKITYWDDPAFELKKPKFLDELLMVSKKLSADVPFLRVDCYITDKQIYFGELTFYPGCGFEPITPYSYDELWGEWLDIS